MIFRAAAFLLILASLAQGVGFRLATFNIGAHLVIPADGGATYFDYGTGAPVSIPFSNVGPQVFYRVAVGLE